MEGFPIEERQQKQGSTWNFHCKNYSVFSLLPHSRPPCILEFLGDLDCNLLGRFYAQTCKINGGMLTGSAKC